MEFGDAFRRELDAMRITKPMITGLKKRAASPADSSAPTSKKRIKSEPLSSQKTQKPQKDDSGYTDEDMASFNDRGTIGKVSCFLLDS